MPKRERKSGRRAGVLPAYTPAGAQWYLGSLVEMITVERHPRRIVHVNNILIRADSPEMAYRKALALGRQWNQKYKNAAGELVRARFLGLRDLGVIHDKLEDGAEISYSERQVLTDCEARQLVAPKRSLGIFAPRRA